MLRSSKGNTDSLLLEDAHDNVAVEGYDDDTPNVQTNSECRSTLHALATVWRNANSKRRSDGMEKNSSDEELTDISNSSRRQAMSSHFETGSRLAFDCQNHIIESEVSNNNNDDSSCHPNTYTQMDGQHYFECEEENVTRQREGGNATILSCVVNLLNTVAGAGMLGLPGAYAGSGFLSGSILLVLASFFSAMGLRFLSISAATVSKNNLSSAGFPNHTPSSFYSVASAALPEFTIFIDAAVALKCFGVATGYFITVGDCMVDAFRYILGDAKSSLGELLTDRQFWIILGLFLVLPISFYKSLDALKFTSTLSLILIYSLAVGVVLYAEGVFDPCEKFNTAVGGQSIIDADRNGHEFGLTSLSQSHSLSVGKSLSEDITRNLFSIDGQITENLRSYQMTEETVGYNINSGRDGDISDDDGACQGDTKLVTSFESTVKNLAVFVFSFTCQQNIFSIVNEIKDRSQTRVDTVIIMAIGSALLLYMTVAIEGYRTYGNEVKSDVLLNYPQTALVTMMRIAIAIMVIFSYPLQLDPSRRCLTSLMHTINTRIKKIRQGRQFYAQHVDDVAEQMLESLSVTFDSSALNQNANKLQMIKNGDGDISDNRIFNTALVKDIANDSNDACSTLQQSIDDSSLDDDARLDQVAKDFLFNGITCSFLVLSFIIAMLVSDLGVILGVVGATGSTMVSYILPGAIYIKLHPWRHSLVIFAWLQLVLGMLIVPTALYFVIRKGTAE